MLYWTEYRGHDSSIIDNKLDNNIYSFDIETTSYLDLRGQLVPAVEYLNLSDQDKQDAIPKSCMYIWMFSINDTVYYGRTWEEFRLFLERLDSAVPEKKYVFVHNLSFEFQFICTQIRIESVMSRKSRKVMGAILKDFNIEMRCSYYMSNVRLAKLPEIFNLPVKKMEGDLDYTKIRHSETPLTDVELGYCENDCLVVYEYIKIELLTYERVDKIPLTATGKVRKELQRLVMRDKKYRRLVGESINIKPSVYNMLVDAFAGGYTHANYIYADEVLNNVDSYDETSAYPYVLVSHRFPSKEFRECNLKSADQMSTRYAYLVQVRFYNLKCRYYNNFISVSKCNNVITPRIDNGRIIRAKMVDITLTDVDFRFILDTYDIESYEIVKSYSSLYNYLPIKYINFILDKYVNKTKFKNVEGKELEYAREKAAFNSIYGMSVTNMIRDEVEYDDLSGWKETELTNADIFDKLLSEKKKSFLSFSWGVWCTAYARDNLLRRVLELDQYVVYCDTDSIKLVQGYDKTVFEKYNASVVDRIHKVSDILKIDFERFSPTDSKGIPHLLGVFESETEHGNQYTYDKFITQGAKKYAVEINGKIKITVSGVPKGGAKCLTKIEDFRDDLIFDYKYTNKNTLMYNDKQAPFDLIDYFGIKYRVTDKSGCCLLPTTYKLGKALEYANLLTDNSSQRAKFKENG